MNMRKGGAALVGAMIVLGLNTTAMATAVACCVYVMKMTAAPGPGGENPGADQQPCSPKGTGCTMSCEQYSDSAATSGKKISEGERLARCYIYCSQDGMHWRRASCDRAPSEGWVAIGKNADGSCCWLDPDIYAFRKVVYHPDGFSVNKCEGAVCP